MPLLTMMPQSMMKPTSDMTLMSKPVRSSPMKPPVNASGMVNMMMNGDLRLWNCATMMR